MSTVKISELPEGVASANAVLVMNNITGTETQRVLAGAIAALSGPVHSVAGRTGAVTIGPTDVSGLTDAVVAIVAASAPVLSVNGLTGAVTVASVSSVNGLTGAVSLSATSVGAALVSHTHATGDIDNFASAVALIAGTTGPVLSVNGLTGAVTIAGGTAEVESVNGLTGAVSLTAETVGAASATHATQHMRGGTDPYLLSLTSVSALTQNENNLSFGNADVVRISAATTNRDITGFTGGSTGVAVLLINIGTDNVVTIKHSHTGSASGNRVLTVGATDYELTENGGAAMLVYDHFDSVWRAV